MPMDSGHNDVRKEKNDKRERMEYILYVIIALLIAFGVVFMLLVFSG